MGATKEKVVKNDQKGKEFTLNDTTTYTHKNKNLILEIKTSNCDFIKIFRILEPLDWGCFFQHQKTL